MSQIIQIQDINSSDTIKTMVEKINYNFDQIMTFGGGPQGEKGDKGELGPDGEQGERGNLITIVDDISTVGSNLKVGDIAIYSNDQYIYEVKENSDNNLFFEKTSICIKGNDGERGASGTSDSPFKYDEIQDAIVTAEVDYNGKIPSHTFIGASTVVSNGLGVLNIVGNGNANGIYLFTGDSDSNYCGKIYGGELDSGNNILVLHGEDNTDNNYVKIDDTLLTDKIHSSDNGIKIAEITTNNEIVLGDSSNNTSIECNEFTVKNGSNTSIRTSSSNIWLKGNLFVNTSDYAHTTSICGKSIDINTKTLCVSTHIQASEDCVIMSHVGSDASANVKTSAYVKTSKNDGVIIEHKNVVNNKYSSVSISSNDGIEIDTNKTIIGRNSQSNTQINGDVTAKVNGVPDVYLGCPIGTIVMWAGTTAPDGWLLCDGKTIYPYDGQRPGADYKGSVYMPLIDVIGNTYGGSMPVLNLPNLQQKFPLGADIGGVGNITDKGTLSLYYNNNDRYYVGDLKIGQFLDLNTAHGLQPSSAYNRYCKIVDIIGSEYNYTINVIECDEFGKTINNKIKNLFDYFYYLPPHTMAKVVRDIKIKEYEYLTTLGSTGGEETHTLTKDEMPAHTHDTSSIRANSKRGDTGTESLYSAFAGGYPPTIEPTGGDEPHNNIPPFLAINFIIKYK